jgi:hypothetical protein
MGFTPDERQVVLQKLQAVTPERATTRNEFRMALEATDDEVQALGIQMNQIYLGSAATVVEECDNPPDFSGLILFKEVMRSTFLGYHLPHMWLAVDDKSERISSLVLAGHGRFVLSQVLVVGVGFVLRRSFGTIWS